MGDCGVAWFIRAEIVAAPPGFLFSVSSPSVPLWKKSNPVLSKTKTEASDHSFCFIVKLRPLVPAGVSVSIQVA